MIIYETSSFEKSYITKRNQVLYATSKKKQSLLNFVRQLLGATNDFKSKVLEMEKSLIEMEIALVKTFSNCYEEISIEKTC